MRLSSPSFDNNGQIPNKYRYDFGENINPPLNISGVPKETKSLVITFEDMEHPEKTLNWIVWNISPQIKNIPENYNSNETITGKNFLTQNEYYGLNPLQGTHTYKFTLYAINVVLDEGKDVDPFGVLENLKEYIIEKTELLCFSSTTDSYAIE